MNNIVAREGMEQRIVSTGMEGKSESEIREEMEKAIMIGFLNKETRSVWNNLFGLGRLPSPEEFIIVFSLNVARR